MTDIKNKSVPEKIVLAAAVFLMGVQILWAFVWMCKNIAVVPAFGDSAEYLELSSTMRLDEYRPVLYPLVLKVILKIGRITGTAYQVWLYLMQTFVSFGSILYGVFTIDRAMGYQRPVRKERMGLVIFLSLYLMSIPMITFMNFCVLTDSLATSMLVVFLSGLVILFAQERVPVWNYALTAAALTAECLLRADRLYSCLLLAVIAFLVRICKNPRGRRQVLAAMLSVCLTVTVLVKGIGAATQMPGINGRIETNLDFILLDRIVWPNMAANYDRFPKEIQEIITRKEAKTFDKHNNNVMYQMAPIVEARAGKENAGRIYRTMASVVFSGQPGKVLGDIGEDILAMAVTPVSSLLNSYKLCDKGDSWNIHCMSSAEPELTEHYNRYYQVTFLILLGMGIVLTACRKIKGRKCGMRLLLRTMMPHIGMGVILTLWFSLGDGAPPNDRYALLIYLDWSLVTAGLLGAWERGQQDGRKDK